MESGRRETGLTRVRKFCGKRPAGQPHSHRLLLADPCNVLRGYREVARMSPVKKGKGKKGGKKKTTTMADEENYRKRTLEVETLKQHLVLRREAARNAMADSEGLKRRLTELEKELEEARGDKQDIYEEMIRQFQQLQSQTDTRIQRLEAETQSLQEQLAVCQEDVRQSRTEKEKMQEEKERAIAKMQRKIDEMETEYEKILHGNLDLVLSKLEAANLGWEKEATALHLEYKDRLKEFGLNPLEV
ncbi:coiled-coil domain-containing protein 153 [Heteronotia binoei]|uniref:coiled-coil domain-containing protein 153 n=1 Tax=Heteronotia binoei TaxID=13085 RepID=UPI00292D217F|nr:coiled-coil domain-containing protein 153 [Heteronotia binoei]